METGEMTIKLSISIKDAMKKMDELRISTLFVTDDANKLIGCVTGGDLGRAILKLIPVQENISKAVNWSPMVITDQDLSRKGEIMERMVESMINHVPLVNDDRTIKKIYNLSDFSGINNPHWQPKNSAVIIMAGGEGTRLRPLTNILPKALAPLGNKPIVQKVIENFEKYGFSNFKISVNYMAEMIKTYFNYARPGQPVAFINENELVGKKLGTIGALSLIKEDLKDAFFVSNCDVLIDANYNEILKFHNHSGNVMTIVGALRNTKIPYGVLNIAQGGLLQSIDEKPEFEHLINTGMYLLNPDAVSLIPYGEEFDIPDLVKVLNQNKLKIGVFPIRSNQWFDIGQWSGYDEVLRSFENKEFAFKQG